MQVEYDSEVEPALLGANVGMPVTHAWFRPLTVNSRLSRFGDSPVPLPPKTLRERSKRFRPALRLFKLLVIPMYRFTHNDYMES